MQGAQNVDLSGRDQLRKYVQLVASLEKQLVTLSSTDEQVALMLCGNPLGTPVVCVHGWLDNCYSFLPLLHELQNTHASVFESHCFVLLDLPGHGLSQHGSSSVLDYVTNLRELASVFGWSTLRLIGHSMGAAIGMFFSASFPEMVEGLVCIDALGMVPATRSIPEQMKFAIENRLLLATKSPRIFPSIEKASEALRGKSPMKEDSALLLLERGLKRVKGGFQLRYDMQVRGAHYWRPTVEDVNSIYHAIQCPVLVIVPDEGLVPALTADSGGVDARRKHFRDLRVAHMKGFHHVHMDDAPTVARHIATFLASLPRMPGASVATSAAGNGAHTPASSAAGASVSQMQEDAEVQLFHTMSSEAAPDAPRAKM